MRSQGDAPIRTGDIFSWNHGTGPFFVALEVLGESFDAICLKDGKKSTWCNSCMPCFQSYVLKEDDWYLWSGSFLIAAWAYKGAPENASKAEACCGLNDCTFVTCPACNGLVSVSLGNSRMECKCGAKWGIHESVYGPGYKANWERIANWASKKQGVYCNPFRLAEEDAKKKKKKKKKALEAEIKPLADSMVWTLSPPSGDDGYTRWGGWRVKGCTCSPEEIAPPYKNELVSLTHQFYEAETLLAHLRAAGVDAGGDCGTMESKLEGVVRSGAERIEKAWLIYLARACAGEARHIRNRRNYDQLGEGVRDDRIHKSLYKSGGDWVKAVRGSVCPICDPMGALGYFRKIHAIFMNDCWTGSFGGKKWAVITEALIARLSAFEKDCEFELNDGSKWCLPHVQWFVQQSGVKPSLRKKLTEAISKYGTAISDEKTMAKIFSIPAIWIDYVADLEHNGGCVLGKGYMVVDEYRFKKMLDFKRNGRLIDEPVFFPQDADRIRCRLRPIPQYI